MTKDNKKISRRGLLKTGVVGLAAGITVPSWFTSQAWANGEPLVEHTFAEQALVARAPQPTPLVDRMIFGDNASELGHGLSAKLSESDTGALNQTARRLLPGGDLPWEGGQIAFTMKVDPAKQTYLTARFWGSDTDPNYLILFCNGKQVGYRHLGDIDLLGVPDTEPRYNGRFFYVTTPLPMAMTQGQTEVPLEIRSTGPIWGYGSTFEQYQKPMTVPARDMYSVYTHTDGCFVPPKDEAQGKAPKGTIRATPGPEVIQQAKDRVNGSLSDFLKSTGPLNQMQMQFLAKAYFVKWTVAYQNPVAVSQVVKGVDAYYARWKVNPDAVWNDPSTWNRGWFGVGPAGDAVRHLAADMSPVLDQPLDGTLTRRAAWSALFQAGCTQLMHHLQWLSNQQMFTATNLYLANRAVEAIDPAHALPEAQALNFLYAAIGLVPWLGSVTADGGRTLQFGDEFHQVTEKGLTREMGYVGGYGEVGTAGVMEIYAATRMPGGEGDPKIKAQLAKMIRARAVFRYPMLDADGNYAMRLETGVGWRDEEFPGDVVYVQPSGGEQSALREAAATLDPYAIGYVQQMFNENQFFNSVAHALAWTAFRATIGLLGTPDQYELLKAQPPSPHRLPMSWGQPDFVFADEQDGVVAIKNGAEILFVSLYWRANFGINNLARTHYLTPDYQQVATVQEETQYDPSGETYTRPDWINFGFGNGGTNIPYPSDIHQAYAGQKLPMARAPRHLHIPANGTTRFAGFGEFYTLRYGPYFIAMNMTKSKTYTCTVPDEGKTVLELTDQRRRVKSGSEVELPPQSTVVYYMV